MRDAEVVPYRDLIDGASVKAMNHIERYIAIKMQPKAFRAIVRHRPVDIEEVRRNRCLTPSGDRFFLDAVVCYLALRTQEGDELVAKSRAFLELAHAASEREKYDYTRGYSEGCRSAVLCYVRWLTDGTSSPDLVENARMNLSAYYSRTRSLDRNAATIAVPVLLYTESYDLDQKNRRSPLDQNGVRSPTQADGAFRPRAFESPWPLTTPSVKPRRTG